MGEVAAAGDDGHVPRTDRGRRTLRAILDAASAEFGERGFQGASISRITTRAGVALGSFYTYFPSKEDVFRAVVRDLSDAVKAHVGPHVAGAADGLSGEGAGLRSFLEFVRTHKEIYRIIDEAEFVDSESYRRHYQSTVDRVRARLQAAAARGEVRGDVGEEEAWAIVGMNVFVGLRYGVWDDGADAGAIAERVNALLRRGLSPMGTPS